MARAATSFSTASRRQHASASSPSTKPTASASGATTSAPSTASSAGCASVFPGASLHAFTATATAAGAARHRRRSSVSRATRARRLVRPAQPHSTACCRAPTLKRQLAGRARSPSRRGGHRLLHSPPRSRRRWPPGSTSTGIAALPVPRRAHRRGAQPASGRVPRRARRHHRRHRGVRHGHRSLERPLRRARRRAASRSSTTSRRRAAPAATASRPSACSISSSGRLHQVAGDARAQRRAHRRRAATCCGDMERYASGVGCRHRHIVGYFGEIDIGRRTPCGGVRLLPGRAGSGRRAGRARAEDPLVRGPRGPALRRRRTSTNVLRGHASEAGGGARPRSAEHVRPAARCFGGRGARLHRPAGRPRLAATDRRRLSGAAAHGARRRRC